jgi:hypothetical protein
LQAAKLKVASSLHEVSPVLVGDGFLTQWGAPATTARKAVRVCCSNLDCLLSRGWRCITPAIGTHVVISDRDEIRVKVINPFYRPVRLETPDVEVHDVTRVWVSSSDRSAVLLMDDD